MPLTALAQDLARETGAVVLAAEPLSRHTTWRIGGPADLVALPPDAAALQACTEFARAHALPWVVIGQGSNLLVADEGFRGLVIKTQGLRRLTFEGNRLRVSCGYSLPRLARLAAQKGLSGLEFAAGIPGSVGGATVMNAGTGDACLAPRIELVEFLTEMGPATIKGLEAGFGYRQSCFKGSAKVVLTVTLALEEEDPAAIRRAMAAGMARRRRNQPLGQPSAGSVFVNPPGQAAGYLVEAAGCKGWRSGGARVSTVHANFIVNDGGATARDVIDLMSRVREAVARRFQVLLETEVVFLGSSGLVPGGRVWDGKAGY